MSKTFLLQRIPAYLLTFLLVLLIFAPINRLHAYHKDSPRETDFYTHRLWAIAIKENAEENIPQNIIALAGWQFILIFINKIAGISFQGAGFLAALMSVGFAALVLFVWYFPLFRQKNYPFWKYFLILLGLLIATPIALLWPLDNKMYLGYLGITSYHNPTILVLKPLALIQFIIAYRSFQSNSPLSKWEIGLGFIVSVLGAYVKPNFAICILPAISAYTAYRMLRKQYVNLKGVFFGVVFPVTLMLAWQFLLTYQFNDEGGIAFMPLVVMSSYSKFLGVKFILSILFPLLVSAVYWRDLAQDSRMVLAWIAFLLGAAYTYLLAETGSRIYHGNFGWSGEIALFILFAASTLFFLERTPAQNKTNFFKPLLIVWGLHVVFGAIYYAYCYFGVLFH